MNYTRKLLTTLLAATLLPCIAMADPIISTVAGPASPATVGGYAMTRFDMVPSFPGSVNSVASPTTTGGNVLFQAQGGATMDMTIASPTWWQYGDHGNVYTTEIHWIELVMPPNTRAFSFFVGAEFNGHGWIEAIDSNNARDRLDPFYVGPGRTPGFSVHSTDACATIDRIIVEPQYWGVGHFAINQSDPCTTTVPEPAPIALFGLGLLALVGSRKFLKPAPDAV